MSYCSSATVVRSVPCVFRRDGCGIPRFVDVYFRRMGFYIWFLCTDHPRSQLAINAAQYSRDLSVTLPRDDFDTRRPLLSSGPYFVNFRQSSQRDHPSVIFTLIMQVAIIATRIQQQNFNQAASCIIYSPFLFARPLCSRRHRSSSPMGDTLN
jgi:hypothetical protein